MAPTDLDRYLNAAARPNTRASYAAAQRHFEEDWGGHLPASVESVARYLAHYAPTLAPNTLRHRLAALARWHADHGFQDPTRAPLIRQTLRGIRVLHGRPERRATPLQIDQLAQVVAALDQAHAEGGENPAATLRPLRDKALLLLGFWRGFRGDELVRASVEHLTLIPGHRLTLFLPMSKGDRTNAGRSYTVPALSRLCPVQAVAAWLEASALRGGPVFRGIDRWGHIAEQGLHTDSLVNLLRRILVLGDVAHSTTYSGHSLRRGLAGWANANGWDVQTLMRYVGWADVSSAMRYIDVPAVFDRDRIEAGLAQDAAN